MRGPSPILITAALSIAVFIGAIGVHLGNTFTRTAPGAVQALEPVSPRAYLPIEDADENGTPDWQDALRESGILVSATSTASSTPDSTLASMAQNVAEALYGGYLSLKQQDSYTPKRGEELAQRIAQNIRAEEFFVPHMAEEIVLADDTSAAMVLKYRADMRTALAPLLTDALPELEYFAEYLQTKDPASLLPLVLAAEGYRAAESNMLTVAVPKDAVPEHLRALNALGAYADTVGRMSRFSGDAFAAVATLKTMNDNEEEMLRAFDALAQYYVRTLAQN